MKKITLLVVPFLLCLFSLQAQPLGERPVTVIRETQHDTSVPLRDVVGLEQPQSNSETGLLLSFEGIPDQHLIGNGNQFSNARADTTIAVGDSQVVEMVEGGFEAYDKSGNPILGPADPSTIFAGFSDVCDTASQLEFPVVTHDQIADRWIVNVESFGSGNVTSAECFAVSTSPDFTGSWNRYEYDFEIGVKGVIVDEGKLAVWPDAYYVSYLANPTMLCAYDRAAMLAGASASSQCFSLAFSDYYTVPAGLAGSMLPPPGEPGFFLELGAPGTQSPSGVSTGDTLNLFKFHVDFTNPSQSTLTGPIQIVTRQYTEACKYEFTCIPQAGTSQTLMAVGNWLTYPLTYRNFGSYQSILASHAVVASSKTQPTTVMWHEIRNPNGTPRVFQQGTAPMAAGESGWLGAIAQDKQGNIALGLTCASPSASPSLDYMTHLASDKRGAMSAPTAIQEGTGSQEVFGYWNYYNAIAVDPVDDCTFWFAGQYLETSGAYNWLTHVASFKFTGCN